MSSLVPIAGRLTDRRGSKEVVAFGFVQSSSMTAVTLTNGALTKQYRIAVNNVIPKGSRISRKYVARLMMETALRHGKK